MIKKFITNNIIYVFFICFSLQSYGTTENLLKRVKDLSSVLPHTVKVYGPTAATLTRYNELRRIIEQPEAASIEDIDFAWIQEVEQEALCLYEEENNKFVQELWQEYMPTGGTYSRVEPASSDMRALVHEARQALGLQEDLIMLSGRSWAIASKDDHSAPSVISIAATDNIHKARYHTYHELSHIYFKHMRMRWDAGKHDKHAWYLQRPEFSQAKQKADTYIKLAQESLDTSTTIGTRIKEKLVGNPPFWIPPTDQKRYEDNLLRINIEREADLFALEKLFEQGHTGSILSLIEEYSKYKVTDVGETAHPSAIEMALYASGFLIHKGCDINKELKSWESNEQKITSEDLVDTEKTKGAQDLLEVYRLWQDQKNEAREHALTALLTKLRSLYLELILVPPIE
jgi:hypothetical protein